MTGWTEAAAGLLLAGALAGCGGSEWTKPGVTEDGFLKDRIECERYAGLDRDVRIPRRSLGRERQLDAHTRLPSRSADELRLFIGCMESRGYTRARK